MQLTNSNSFSDEKKTLYTYDLYKYVTRFYGDSKELTALCPLVSLYSFKCFTKEMILDIVHNSINKIKESINDFSISNLLNIEGMLIRDLLLTGDFIDEDVYRKYLDKREFIEYKERCKNRFLYPPEPDCCYNSEIHNIKFLNALLGSLDKLGYDESSLFKYNVNWKKLEDILIKDFNMITMKHLSINVDD